MTDLTIAAMDTGSRAALSNILDRGLASLPKAARDEHIVELVHQLQNVLRDTLRLDAYRGRVLQMLALYPAGRQLLGVDPAVLRLMDRDGLIEERVSYASAGRAWHITFTGWSMLFDSGRADTLIGQAIVEVTVMGPDPLAPVAAHPLSDVPVRS